MLGVDCSLLSPCLGDWQSIKGAVTIDLDLIGSPAKESSAWFESVISRDTPTTFHHLLSLVQGKVCLLIDFIFCFVAFVF